MLEDLGNAVRVLDRVIPAVNIQVEGVPGVLKHEDGTEAWYGIYFEIMFEDGHTWEVEKGFTPEEDFNTIFVFHCDSREDYSIDPDNLMMFETWEEFLENYDIRRKVCTRLR